jgi:hypothetical protein
VQGQVQAVAGPEQILDFLVGLGAAEGLIQGDEHQLRHA